MAACGVAGLAFECTHTAFFVGIALSATHTVQIRVVDGVSSFQPAIVAAAIGDTVNFKWPTAAQNPQNHLFSVQRSNNSFPCQALPDANPTWASTASSDPAFVFPLDITASNFTDRTSYAFKGSNSGNAGACPVLFDPKKSNQNVFAGSLIVGNFNYVCASATTKDGCVGLIPSNAALYGACVWCGFGSNNLNDGFCYTPAWSGINNCPCNTLSCFSHYGCPAAATAVYCGSACFNANSTSQTCPQYVPPSSGALAGASAALLLVLLTLATVF